MASKVQVTQSHDYTVLEVKHRSRRAADREIRKWLATRPGHKVISRGRVKNLTYVTVEEECESTQ